MKAVRLGLNNCNILKGLAQDRPEWRFRIHVADNKAQIITMVVVDNE